MYLLYVYEIVKKSYGAWSNAESCKVPRSRACLIVSIMLENVLVKICKQLVTVNFKKIHDVTQRK